MKISNKFQRNRVSDSSSEWGMALFTQIDIRHPSLTLLCYQIKKQSMEIALENGIERETIAFHR